MATCEAAVVGDIDDSGMDSMSEAIASLSGELEIEPIIVDTRNEFFYQHQ